MRRKWDARCTIGAYSSIMFCTLLSTKHRLWFSRIKWTFPPSTVIYVWLATLLLNALYRHKVNLIRQRYNHVCTQMCISPRLIRLEDGYGFFAQHLSMGIFGTKKRLQLAIRSMYILHPFSCFEMRQSDNYEYSVSMISYVNKKKAHMPSFYNIH